MVALSTLFITTSMQFGLPSGLLESVCWIESSHNHLAVHHDDGGSDSIGLCQIKFKTAKWMGFRGKESELYKPEVNAYYAAKYLKYLIGRQKGNTIRAIIAYNRGNAKGLHNTPYSAKVIKHWGFLNGHNSNSAY